MSNTITGSSPVAQPSHLALRDARPDDDNERESFAGMFAGAAQAQTVARPIVAPKKPEGTSELDGAEDADAKEPDDADGTQPATSASDAIKTTNASDPSSVDRSLTALDPALQERLARVMTKLRAETGRGAQVSETYRSQARQNVLFAQGRSTPGPIVTWTQNSKHTQGRAVDLVVDGGEANPNAYTTLQRIAKEEGLRTLGARDPGHLELASNESGEVVPTAAPAADVISVARVAQLAPTARVAEVSVARVASLGSVARPAGSNPASSPSVHSTKSEPAPTRPSNAANGATTQPVFTQTGGSDGQQFGANQEERGQRNGDRDGGVYGAALGIGRHSTTQFVVPNIASDVGTSAAQRVAHVIAAREDAPARALSQIVMSVDAGNGTTDRIQVAMRGSSLSATIDAADPRAAHAMNARSNELVRALTRDGVDVESLRVRAVASVAAPAAADPSQRSTDSSAGSRSERGAQWAQQQHRQRADDERRQQQREQRGGKES